MSYAAAIDQLSAMAPELHTQPGQQRRKFSLTEIGALLTALGNPHCRFPSVLIAGTNGKGSTASTLASILRASGLRTGLYTSPHLVRPNERIRVHGPTLSEEISDDAFAGLYFRVHDCSQQLVLNHTLDQMPSFFETLTAMAFLHFADEKVDIAVLEVGMGGRLDATNIVDPILSIVTDISLDHTEWLGPTIAAIAREKAGILRANGTLITLPQHPEANQVLGEVATQLGTRAVSAVPYMPAGHAGVSRVATPGAPPAPASSYPVEVMGTLIHIDSPLHGDHQHRNIALAIAAAVELATCHSFPITPASIEQGIRTTQWPGRLEVIATPSRDATAASTSKSSARSNSASHKQGVPHPSAAWVGKDEPAPAVNLGAPDPGSAQTGLRLWGGDLALETWDAKAPHHAETHWILDVAHNPAGAWALRAALRSEFGLDPPEENAAVLLFSCLRDKPLTEMAQILFPLFDEIIFAPIHSPRATPMRDLLAAAEAIGVPARAAGTVEEALVWAESSPIVSDDIARPPSTVGEADAYSEGVGGLNPGTSSSFGSGHGFSRVATAVIKKEGALAPARTGTRTALRVVAGSVYLVGEIRPILLDRAQAAQAQSLQAQLPQAQ